jgi:hypothetical protein
MFPNTGNRIERGHAMLLLKYVLLSAGIAMFLIAAAILTCDAYWFVAGRRRLNFDPERGAPGVASAIASARWLIPIALVMLAWAPLLISAGIVIVPSLNNSRNPVPSSQLPVLSEPRSQRFC